MRSATRKHLSVVGGIARFAMVTVAEAAKEAPNDHKPLLFLNDRNVEHFTSEETKLIEAAVQGLREAEAKLNWQGLPLRVVKVDSSYVDMHPEAARLAAIAAATELIQGK